MPQHPQTEVILSDQEAQCRDRTSHARLKKLFVTFRSCCLESSDWNIDIALFLTVSNCICFGHLYFPSEEWDKDNFGVLWVILTCLGAFGIPSGITHGDAFVESWFYIVQLLASLTLLSGVYYKRKSRLEFWLVVNLCTCVHSAWWSVSFLLLGHDVELRISNSFGLGAVLVCYYCFNGLYMWRIYGLICREDPTTPFPQSGICCQGIHCCCFIFTAICTLLVFWGFVEFHPFHLRRNYENVYVAAGIMGFVMFCTCSLLAVKPMCRLSVGNQNSVRFLTLLWSRAVAVVLIIFAVCQLKYITSRERFDRGLSHLLIFRFLFLDLPAAMSIFIAFGRMKRMTVSTDDAPWASGASVDLSSSALV